MALFKKFDFYKLFDFFCPRVKIFFCKEHKRILLMPIHWIQICDLSGDVLTNTSYTKIVPRKCDKCKKTNS